MSTTIRFILGLFTFFTAFTSNSFAQTFAWAGSFSGANSVLARSVTVDVDGNIYTLGVFEGVVDFDPGPGVFSFSSVGGTDIFISKLDASGNFVWAKQIGSTSYESPYNIAVDASGNIYITGTFQDVVDFDPGAGTYLLTSFGLDDAFISKYDSSGNLVWAKQIGGSSFEVGSSIAVDEYANVYTTGNFSETADLDPGAGIFYATALVGSDTYISKLDSSGNYLWSIQLEAAMGLGITVDNDGYMYVTGNFNGTEDFDPGVGIYNLTSSGGYDVYISKFDVSGNIIWAKGVGGPIYEWVYSIAVDQDGNVATTGIFNDTADFDPGTGTFYLTSAGNEDIYVSKLDSSGNFLWAKKFGEYSNDYGYSIDIGSNGNIFTTGYFRDTVDFDPGIDTFNLISISGDIFISELDAAGNFVWAANIGSNGGDIGTCIHLDAGNIYVAGSFASTTDFDPGVDTFYLTNTGFGDAFVLKLLNEITGFSNSFKESVVPIIYPNPSADGKFNIASPESIDEIIILDLLGQAVQKIIPADKNVTLQIADEGIYFIQLISGESIELKKVVVVN